MSHIILVTHWTGGDVLPFLRLGRVLKEDGHRVTVFTHCVYEESAARHGIEFIAVDTPSRYEEMNRDLFMLADPVNAKEDCVRFHNTYHGKEQLLHEVSLLERLCDDDTIIIARHRSSVSGLLAAEKLHLPYASLILAPNYFSHMNLHEQLFGNEIRDEINKARAELGLCRIGSWKDWLYSPEYIFCGWPEWYAEPDETWPKCAYPIGFPENKKTETAGLLDDEVTAFVAETRSNGKKLILITGGSSKMIDPEFYRVATEACVKAGVNSIVVTPYEAYIPKGLPNTVLWSKRVFLPRLMEEADVIIHHGGMGTINEAIDAGIPHIVMPHLTDGPDNADRLVKMGIAVKFPKKRWDASEIANAIGDMAQESKRKKCEEYKKQSRETYRKRAWRDVLPTISRYEYVGEKAELANVQKRLGEGMNSEKPKLTKEQLLEVLRRRKQL